MVLSNGVSGEAKVDFLKLELDSLKISVSLFLTSEVTWFPLIYGKTLIISLNFSRDLSLVKFTSSIFGDFWFGRYDERVFPGYRWGVVYASKT